MTGSLNRLQMAWRAAQDLRDGEVVNLGLGMPTKVAEYLPGDREVFFQSENGILGMGPAPDIENPDLKNAGGQPVTVVQGGALFDSNLSFLMMTGGHLDMTILGAFQVSAAGDLANWDMNVPGKGPLVGGAMDLACGAIAVRVIMNHTTKKGAPCLVEECSYPLTGLKVVKTVYTDIAVVDVTPSGFVAREMIEGMTIQALQEQTGAPITAAQNCGILSAPDLGDPE